MQGAAQVHYLGRQLIAFERGANLVRDAFDERHLMILKTFSRCAPHQTEQAKGLTSHPHRGHQGCASTEYGVEH